MADSSRLFNPGQGMKPPENDAMVERIPLDKMTHGARTSQTGQKWDNGGMAVKHIANRN